MKNKTTNKHPGDCDFENAIRKGRANWRCPKCDRDLTLELVLMYDAGVEGMPIP